MTETTELSPLELALQPFTCSVFWTNDEQSALWQFATFTIHLPEPVLVEGEPGEPVSMGVNLDGFDAEVLITLSPKLGRVKKQSRNDSEERWYYAASELEVTISRHEPAAAEGREPDHFRSVLLPEYRTAAIEAANRCAAFLRQRLWRSLFEAIERFESDLADPEAWVRNDISQRRRFAIADMDERLQDVQQAYCNGHYSPELAEALLAEAQQSILDKRLQRATLELSMACEVTVKRRIPSVAQLPEVIDDGFKGRYQAAYLGLSTLFAARDEITRQAGYFRFTSAQRREMQREQIKEWGASVACLRSWMAPR